MVAGTARDIEHAVSGAPLREDAGMILEHALLNVRPGRAPDFEAAFAEATPIISAMPGFQKVTLSRCLERPGSSLLPLDRARLEDHVDGFRPSPQVAVWKQLRPPFYSPSPSALPRVQRRTSFQFRTDEHRPVLCANVRLTSQSQAAAILLRPTRRP